MSDTSLNSLIIIDINAANYDPIVKVTFESEVVETGKKNEDLRAHNGMNVWLSNTV